MEELPLPQARRAYDKLCRTFSPPDPTGMRIDNSVYDGVSLRRFIPQQRMPGCVLFIHGGGFTIGSVESHHGPAASLAQRLECEVVSVNYRLAPEVDYPTMLADCQAVLAAVHPVALVGDSAGGRLAIDLAHQHSDAPPLGLIYPPVGELSPECLGEDAPCCHAATCSVFVNSALRLSPPRGIKALLLAASKCLPWSTTR